MTLGSLPIEILPGLMHWTAIHPTIGTEVSSYWLRSGVAIDPLLDEAVGVEWFAAQPHEPAAVLLTNRHHYRSAGQLSDRFGCEVLCNESGLQEFTAAQQVNGFSVGDTLPGPALACEVGSICPDDTALYLPEQHALAFADAIVRGERGLGFVPDVLMDDPPGTKRGILDSCERLLADPRLDFQHLLLAHGGPVLGDGRERLTRLVETGGRTAFDM